MRDRALRWALRLHPLAWRERYGEELYDLSEELLGVGHIKWSRLSFSGFLDLPFLSAVVPYFA